MRFRNYLPIVILLCTVSLQAAKLKGIILENQDGGLPMSNVRVSAIGANPTETGDSGTFTLIFPQALPGDVVNVIVSKPGYVVLNYIQTRVTLPKAPDAEPLQILLCKESEREEWARRFFRLKSLEAIEATYKRRIAALETSNERSSIALAQLREERDQAKRAADNIAEELARVRPSDITDLYTEAMALFLKGDVQASLVLLSEEKLKQAVESAKRKKAEAEQELAKAVESYLLKSRLLFTQFQFAEAENVYRAALDVAPESLEVHLAFGHFSHQLRHFKIARKEYEESLRIAEASGAAPETSLSLNSLAELDQGENRAEVARERFNKALEIRRDLAAQNPARFSPLLALTLNDLAILDNDENKMVEARKHFEEALQLRRQLAAKNPDLYSLDVALTLSNIATLDGEENRKADARQHFKEALDIAEQVASKYPDELSHSSVGVILNNLANMDRDEKHFTEARQKFDKALVIFQELSKQNPNKYLPRVAMLLTNLANVDSDEHRTAEAEQGYEKALSIRRQLALQDPENYLPTLAITLNNLADFENRKKDYAGAHEHYAEALSIRRKLAEKNPATYLPPLAVTLDHVATLEMREDDKTSAGEHFGEAVKINRRLAESAPNVYLPQLAVSLYNTANFYMKEGRNQSARDSYEEAATILRGFGQESTHLPLLASVLNNLAALDSSEHRRMDSVHHCQAVVQIYRQLILENPEAYASELADSLKNLAFVNLVANRPAQAREDYQEALGIYRRLVEINPTNGRFQREVLDLEKKLRRP